jgi:hypothetical protein
MPCGIVATASELRLAPAPRPFDLREEIDPNLQEVRGSLTRSLTSIAYKVGPSRHDWKDSPTWFRIGWQVTGGAFLV